MTTDRSAVISSLPPLSVSDPLPASVGAEVDASSAASRAKVRSVISSILDRPAISARFLRILISSKRDGDPDDPDRTEEDDAMGGSAVIIRAAPTSVA